MKLDRQFSRREKVLLIILALLVLFAAYFYGVHYPAVQTKKNAGPEIENLNTEIAVLEAKKVKMDKMSAELETLLASPDTVAIPDYDNLQELISFLNTVLYNTEDFDISFPGIKMPADSGHIARRYLRMSFVSPNYDAARKMVDLLQASPYCCQINELQMECVNVDYYTKRVVEDAALTEWPVRVTVSMTFFENTETAK